MKQSTVIAFLSDNIDKRSVLSIYTQLRVISYTLNSYAYYIDRNYISLEDVVKGLCRGLNSHGTYGTLRVNEGKKIAKFLWYKKVKMSSEKVTYYTIGSPNITKLLSLIVVLLALSGRSSEYYGTRLAILEGLRASIVRTSYLLVEDEDIDDILRMDVKPILKEIKRIKKVHSNGVIEYSDDRMPL